MQDYLKYLQSFLPIKEKRIQDLLQQEISLRSLCPEPLIQFNPAFATGSTLSQLTQDRILTVEMTDIFSGYSLYKHQVEGIKLGVKSRDFVVTSGTGSGKSLIYLATIFNHLFQEKSGKNTGIKAILVYPMNALVNSQKEEIEKFKNNYERTGKQFPFTFAQYTGQEKQDERLRIRAELPDILLTNYMMLELILTRLQESVIRDSISQHLRFLVFDELHTYRGRQGADVAMLIRRIRTMCQNPLTCIGTSATMISAESEDDNRSKVAEVASRIFGKKLTAEQVIVEHLDRSLNYAGTVPGRQTLLQAIQKGIDTTGDESALRAHPLAIWLENRIALDESNGFLTRRRPRTLTEMAACLRSDSGADEKDCIEVITDLLKWIASVNSSLAKTRKSYLPFKLHQFISQSGDVYVTLESPEKRIITLEPAAYSTAKNGAPKPLYPVVFSRISGQEYICVTKSIESQRLEPRGFEELVDEEDDKTAGYLLLDEDAWNPDVDLEQLPEAWVRIDRNGQYKPQNKYKDRLPQRIYFDDNGNFSDSTSLQYKGWFIKAPLLFDPSCGALYDPRTKENTKLAKLGSQGRSTSTTVLSFLILKHLAANGYQDSDQKVLSFTDNRQDASLQAGHFNDFIEVIRLRSGIYHALENAPSHTLDHSQLGDAIFRALRLPFSEYANLDTDESTIFPSTREAFDSALKDYLVYRALYDLKRGWRVVLPNLEQCALLKIDYKNLDLNCAYEAAWQNVPLLNRLDVVKRKEVVYQILDYFRKAYAIYSEVYLKSSVIEQKRKIIDEKLKAPWKFDENEKISLPSYMRIEPLRPGTRLYSQSVGANSALGKYLRQVAKEQGIICKGDDYKKLVSDILNVLCSAGWLKRETAKNVRNEEIHIYQLRIDQIEWKLGDGKTVYPDLARNRFYKESSLRPNSFFQQIYKTDFASFKRLEGREHTAQLQNDDRADREERFRSGQISCLFCSPTMELGIDIADLNVVHMRNAPPNPANYAQRGGRAGRSGQAAMVFTYCSNYSPHDRHYFKNAITLVAGAVAPPRIDLANEELLTSHLNAIYLSLKGVSEMDNSLAGLVGEADDVNLPLKKIVQEKLSPSEPIKRKVKAIFSKVIADFADEEIAQKFWFSDTWIDNKLDTIVQQLDRALDRWRRLYQAAISQLNEASAIINSGLYPNASHEMKEALRNQKQAIAQRDLLRNEMGKRNNQLSEFYPYRYLASEGFIPGYNFTRLPIRTFIPVGDSGEYISRQRFIAIREFGPGNIIYHNGAKYRIEQMLLPDITNRLKRAKVSINSGYFLMDEEYSLELCPVTGVPLHDDKSRELYVDLLEMAETRCEQVERISCEEEERLSRGYDTKVYFSVPGGLERIIKVRVKNDEADFLNLRFIPTARLFQLNRGWVRSRERGFLIGLISGRWKKQTAANTQKKKQPTEKTPEDVRRIQLYTTDTADALHIEPIKALGLTWDGVITLQYALKRAIESIFQVEPREIGVVPIGDERHPNIFIYEATEGSLGILSQFMEDHRLFEAVVKEAYSICRYDDTEYTEPASYDDLLSYYNQRYHAVIDRFKIKDALEKLMSCRLEILTNPGHRSYEEHYQSLLRNIDPNSSTERDFLDFLYRNGLRLPDKAQARVEGIYVQPDFFFEPDIWVFCDGTPHDDPSVKAQDERVREAIRSRGDQVIVYHYKERIEDVIAKRPDIFRKVK